MTFLAHDPGPVDECPVCHHPPIQHIEDGARATCLICSFLAMKSAEYGHAKIPHICTRKFQFKLSLAERTQAMAASKASFEQKQLCAVCNCEWRQHWGYLCPSGDSLFVPVIESKLPFLITH
jgi:hypothetical protein